MRCEVWTLLCEFIFWFIYPSFHCHTMFARIILCMRPANERRCYIAMSFLICWAHTQNATCTWTSILTILPSGVIVPYKQRRTFESFELSACRRSSPYLTRHTETSKPYKNGCYVVFIFDKWSLLRMCMLFRKSIPMTYICLFRPMHMYHV